MNIKKIIMAGLVAAASGAMALDYVEVTDVKARQRYPWNGKVDIDFQLDSKSKEPYQMLVEVFDNVGKTNLTVKNVCAEGVSTEANPCMVRADTSRIVWDASKDLPNGFKCTNVLVTCRDSRLIAVDKLYCVIDLSNGTKEYLSGVPTGGWTAEHKTTKMVFRRIAAGSFMMGSPSDELNRQSNEAYHKVTITKPYYISVFELTGAQYAKINGNSSSELKPKLLRFGEVRGHDLSLDSYTTGYDYYDSETSETSYNYPKSKNVDSKSLVGKLRTKTGISSMDLPTEAQWEFASRGETIKALNTGYDSIDTYMAGTGRYDGNREDLKGDASSVAITHVGCYAPNGYGLFDMLGNAREWCLDAWKNDLGTSAVSDPIGNSALTLDTSENYGRASVRVVKGGGFYNWHRGGKNAGKNRTVENGTNQSGASLAACRNASRVKGYSSYHKDGMKIGVDIHAYYTCEGVRLVFSAE